MMIIMHQANVSALLCAGLGEQVARAALTQLHPGGTAEDHARSSRSDAARVSRAEFAQALNCWLYVDLLDRVPSGRAYVDESTRAGGRVRFDHGALRTIRFANRPTGALPPGRDAFSRILEPLGYRAAEVYPLPQLKMTGYAFRHLDFPETISQFFVSELEVARFDAEFEAAAQRVFGDSRDPLDAETQAVLQRLERDSAVSREEAECALPILVRCFGRQHGIPYRSDFELLAAQSAEAAWIATEGNSFNHVTDRVDDVLSLAERLRSAGRPIKARVERSASGRVLQTAYRADPVMREFYQPDGSISLYEVPGSFYEFITRKLDPSTGALDLSFDSSNATGIFAMTRAA